MGFTAALLGQRPTNREAVGRKIDALARIPTMGLNGLGCGGMGWKRC